MHALPDGQLGYVLPVGVADGVHHAFYSVCGMGLNMVAFLGGLAQFSPEAGAAALAGTRPAIDFLAARQVDRIVLGGLPVTTAVPRDEVLALCAAESDRVGIPVSSDAEDTVEALQALGATRVALATKWAPPVVAGVERYLRSAGVEVVRDYALPHSATEVVALGPADGYAIALELAKGALADQQPVDALVLGGGAWFVLPALEVIEHDYGVPVVNNIAATLFGFLRQLGRRPVAPGWGTLLDGLPAPA